MAIYVDKLRNWGWRLGPSCHLISDAPPGDSTELHEFAKKLGLKRSWFQTDGDPHYDLTASKRALAVHLGAIELEDRPFHEILERWRDAAIARIEATDDEEERKRIRAELFS